MHAGTSTSKHKHWANTANTHAHRKQVQRKLRASSISSMRRKSERNVWLVPRLISLVCVDVLCADMLTWYVLTCYALTWYVLTCGWYQVSSAWFNMLMKALCAKMC